MASTELQHTPRHSADHAGYHGAHEAHHSDDGHNVHHGQRWLILAVLGLAQLMVILDATIVNIALPSAQAGARLLRREPAVDRHRLRAGLRRAAAARRPRWLTCFGRKRTLLLGLVGFAVASAVGGAAQSLRDAGRRPGAQGVFGALLAPAGAVAADHDVHRREGARQGVRHLRRDRRCRWRHRPAARRGADRVPRWRWCMYVNVAFAVAGRARRHVLLHDQARTATRTARPPRHAHRRPSACSRSSTASPRPRPTAGPTTSRWASSPPSCSCCRLRRTSSPGSRTRCCRCASSSTATAAARSSPCCTIGAGHVRRLPVPHLLPAAEPRLLADPHRRRVPADDRVALAPPRPPPPAWLPRVGARPLVPPGFLVAAAGMLWLTQPRRRASYLPAASSAR